VQLSQVCKNQYGHHGHRLRCCGQCKALTMAISSNFMLVLWLAAPPPPENFLGGTVRVWEDGEGGEDREDLVSLLMKAVSQQGGHCQANVVVLDALWCLSRASTGAACHPQVTCAEPPLEYKRRVQL
jgi:hypothetical protein